MTAMHKLVIALITAACLAGCSKTSRPSSSPISSGDAVQQKLETLSGSGATDCGRIKGQAPDQLRNASACAMQAAQNKRPFYVAYDMPGLTVGVAGNAEGKLFAIQSMQPENAQPGSKVEVKSDPCPSALRVAESGRVTCYAPGSFGGAPGASPHGGAMPAMPPAAGESPHGGMGMPPPGTPNPHASGAPKKQSTSAKPQQP